MPSATSGEALERTLHAATNSVRALCNTRHSGRAVHELMHFLSDTIVPLFRRHAAEIGAADGASSAMQRPDYSHFTTGMLQAAMAFSEALLEYVRANPEAGELASRADRWPVFIAQDPRYDIRKVVRNPDGPAAMFYKPILKTFGKKLLLDWGNTRSPGAYHEIAMEAAEFVHSRLHWRDEVELHESRLPWMFDYPDGVNPYALPATVCRDGKQIANEPRMGDGFQWATAVKYYLHLRFAPEPDRTLFRNYWRNFRRDRFNSFDLTTPAESRLRFRLAELEATNSESGTDPVVFHPSRESCALTMQADRKKWLKKLENWDPAREAPPEYEPCEPGWVTWWRRYLQHEPHAIFRNPPLIDGAPEPAISNMVDAPAVSGKPSGAFLQSVPSVLDAFLHGCGVINGLSAIQSMGRPLPRIRKADRGR